MKKLAVPVALLVAAAPATAFAADAGTVAANFTSLMTTVGSASAIGLGICGVIAIIVGNLASAPKWAGGGKAALLGAAALMVVSQVLGAMSGTITRLTA